VPKRTDWPELRYESKDVVARPGQEIEALATKTAQMILPFGRKGNSKIDLRKIIKNLGIELRIRSQKDWSSSGLEAMIMPSDASFRIVVWTGIDNKYQLICQDMTKREFEQLRQFLIRYRMAHELAHTFFYRWSTVNCQKPYRTILNRGGFFSSIPEEEFFCDKFAEALLQIRASNQEIDFLGKIWRSCWPGGLERRLQRNW
jgi:hypothetical protein